MSDDPNLLPDSERRKAPGLSRAVESVLNLAIKEAADRRHEFLTIEHVLFALLYDDETKGIIHACGGSIDDLRKELVAGLDEHMGASKLKADQLPVPTVGFQRVLQRAAHSVFSAGKDVIDGANLLIAIYSEPDSYASYYLEKQGVTRLDVVRFVSHGIAPDTGDDSDNGSLADQQEGDRHPSETKDDEESSSKDKSKARNPLRQYCVDLNERAREGKIDPLIGREAEIERTIHVLMRRRKNNPLYVGDPGVGKTALAEGLALRIQEKKVPRALLEAKIFSLDLGSLLAGSKFRGDFEERIKGVLKALKNIPNSILFVDEIHNLVGAGSVSGGSMDAANLLKPMLASGEVRCIGSTTFKEFRNHFEHDQALARRFQKIDVNEPSIEDAVKIIEGLKPNYEEHHNVKYSKDALRAAVELSVRYLPDRRLPDKAVDVLDEAGAALALKRDAADAKAASVSVTQIEATVSRMARVPVERVNAAERGDLQNLEGRLKAGVFGQDRAIESVVRAIKLSKAGLGAVDKPIGSFLFTGPTGVGKTEVAKQLAKVLGIEFIRFDMSEYMEKHSVSRLIGAPPGYVGFEQGGLLTEAMIKSPHAVLLLDEIEKAHPDLQSILLQVMDHGTLTDTNGRKADFRNVVIILTTNAGAEELARGGIGFGRKEPGAAQQGLSEAVKNSFSPEFRNRLNGIITFGALPRSVVEDIVAKFIAELNDQLRNKKVVVSLNEEAKVWLAEKGYDAAYGARPLHRTIEEHIKKPLADEILFGRLSKGGEAVFSVGADGLVFEVRHK
jgi:ATP-dependent Clp protease ATP-binding subunit ClpA